MGTNAQILVGDCVEEMAKMPADSVDAVVCDPPYGLEFMGREWDRLQVKSGPNGSKVGMAFEYDSSPEPRAKDNPWQKERPSYGAPKKNPRCRKCSRLKLDKESYRCKCEAPDWDTRTAEYARNMQEWHEAWAREAFRVLKPGGFAVVAGGTRTFHRLVCALEDAGFEIRDTISHIYGSGFPKSKSMKDIGHPELGTALKPAFEPWTLARKPLSEKNVAQNVLRHGTGAINVDATRVRASSLDSVSVHGAYNSDDKDPSHTGGQTNGTLGKQHLGASAELHAHDVRRLANECGCGRRGLELPDSQGDCPVCRRSDDVQIHSEEASGLIAVQRQGDAHRLHDPDATGEDTRLNQSTTPDNYTTTGRWPPNLLLSHHPDCKPTGEVRRVKGGNDPRKRDGTRSQRVGNEGWDRPWKQGERRQEIHAGYADPDGTEPQEVWECVASCPIRLLDEMSGESKKRLEVRTDKDDIRGGQFINQHSETVEGKPHVRNYEGQGGASRFFPRFEGEAPFRYQAKASRRERNAGLEGMPEKTPAALTGRKEGSPGLQMKVRPKGGTTNPYAGQTGAEPRANLHPTVKPIALMRWLVRLVTPLGGTVLDPFAGSGSTGCAAAVESVNFIGIEMDAEYAEIARRRIAHWSGESSRRLEKPETNGHTEASEATPLETLF